MKLPLSGPTAYAEIQALLRIFWIWESKMDITWNIICLDTDELSRLKDTEIMKNEGKVKHTLALASAVV